MIKDIPFVILRIKRHFQLTPNHHKLVKFVMKEHLGYEQNVKSFNIYAKK